MKKSTLALIVCLSTSLLSCNEQEPKKAPSKIIIMEQDSLLKILDEQDSIVIINTDSQKTRKVLPDTK